MSCYWFAVILALAGQLSADNRYDNPFGSDAATPQSPPPPRAETEINDSPGMFPPPENATPATPTNSQQREPADDSLADEPRLKPADLLREILAPTDAARLAGRDISLDDVLSGGTSRSDQSLRIEAYWDLSASVADYYLAVREQAELRELKSLVPSAGIAWQTAETELGIRIGTAERAAVALQFRLANIIGANETDELPLPIDLPHCGDYYTRYDQVFVGRGHPPRMAAEAQQLSDLLPLRYEELTDAAAAVARAEQWLDSVAARRTATTTGAGILRAHELLALRRRAFVAIVRDYNHRIARYTELAAPGPIDAARLTSMLISRDEDASAAAGRATAPATFTEGWSPVDELRQRTDARDEAVRPASADSPSAPRREHSLLVPTK